MIKQIFSTDGKLYALLSTMVQILELNVLMVLFSLPLVTIGASISAAYSVCRRMRREGDVAVWREFVREFRRGFAKPTGLWAMLLTAGIAMVLGFQELQNLTNSFTPLMLLILAAYGVILMAATYMFMLPAYFTMSVGEIIRGSFSLALQHLLPSTACVVVTIVLMGGLPVFAPRLLLVWLLFAPASCVWINVLILEPILLEHVAQSRPAASHGTTPRTEPTRMKADIES